MIDIETIIRWLCNELGTATVRDALVKIERENQKSYEEMMRVLDSTNR